MLWPGEAFAECYYSDPNCKEQQLQFYERVKTSLQHPGHQKTMVTMLVGSTHWVLAGHVHDLPCSCVGGACRCCRLYSCMRLAARLLGNAVPLFEQVAANVVAMKRGRPAPADGVRTAVTASVRAGSPQKQPRSTCTASGLDCQEPRQEEQAGTKSSRAAGAYGLLTLVPAPRSTGTGAQVAPGATKEQHMLAPAGSSARAGASAAGAAAACSRPPATFIKRTKKRLQQTRPALPEAVLGNTAGGRDPIAVTCHHPDLTAAIQPAACVLAEQDVITDSISPSSPIMEQRLCGRAHAQEGQTMLPLQLEQGAPNSSPQAMQQAAAAPVAASNAAAQPGHLTSRAGRHVHGPPVGGAVLKPIVIDLTLDDSPCPAAAHAEEAFGPTPCEVHAGRGLAAMAAPTDAQQGLVCRLHSPAGKQGSCADAGHEAQGHQQGSEQCNDEPLHSVLPGYTPAENGVLPGHTPADWVLGRARLRSSACASPSSAQPHKRAHRERSWAAATMALFRDTSAQPPAGAQLTEALHPQHSASAQQQAVLPAENKPVPQHASGASALLAASSTPLPEHATGTSVVHTSASSTISRVLNTQLSDRSSPTPGLAQALCAAGMLSAATPPSYLHSPSFAAPSTSPPPSLPPLVHALCRANMLELDTPPVTGEQHQHQRCRVQAIGSARLSHTASPVYFNPAPQATAAETPCVFLGHGSTAGPAGSSQRPSHPVPAAKRMDDQLSDHHMHGSDAEAVSPSVSFGMQLCHIPVAAAAGHATPLSPTCATSGDRLQYPTSTAAVGDMVVAAASADQQGLVVMPQLCSAGSRGPASSGSPPRRARPTKPPGLPVPAGPTGPSGQQADPPAPAQSAGPLEQPGAQHMSGLHVDSMPDGGPDSASVGSGAAGRYAVRQRRRGAAVQQHMPGAGPNAASDAAQADVGSEAVQQADASSPERSLAPPPVPDLGRATRTAARAQRARACQAATQALPEPTPSAAAEEGVVGVVVEERDGSPAAPMLIEPISPAGRTSSPSPPVSRSLPQRRRPRRPPQGMQPQLHSECEPPPAHEPPAPDQVPLGQAASVAQRGQAGHPRSPRSRRKSASVPALESAIHMEVDVRPHSKESVGAGSPRSSGRQGDVVQAEPSMAAAAGQQPDGHDAPAVMLAAEQHLQLPPPAAQLQQQWGAPDMPPAGNPYQQQLPQLQDCPAGGGGDAAQGKLTTSQAIAKVQMQRVRRRQQLQWQQEQQQMMQWQQEGAGWDIEAAAPVGWQQQHPVQGYHGTGAWHGHNAPQQGVHNGDVGYYPLQGQHWPDEQPAAQLGHGIQPQQMQGTGWQHAAGMQQDHGTYHPRYSTGLQAAANHQQQFGYMGQQQQPQQQQHGHMAQLQHGHMGQQQQQQQQRPQQYHTALAAVRTRDQQVAAVQAPPPQQRQQAITAAWPSEELHTVHGAELNMHYWDVPLYVYEVLPFQQHALDFAAWCNQVSPAQVRALRDEMQKRDFAKFTDRWEYIKSCMESNRPDTEMHASFGSTGAHQQQRDGLQPLQYIQEQSRQRYVPDQEGVLRWAPGTRECVRVFCEEYLPYGKDAYTRRFIVSTYKEIWRRMVGKDAAERHYYEIVTADRPCHMYFDIEFSRAANPGVDGPQLVQQVIDMVKQLCRDDFELELDDSCFLELASRVGLDATTPPPPPPPAPAPAPAPTAGSASARAVIGYHPAQTASQQPPPWNADGHHLQHAVHRTPALADGVDVSALDSTTAVDACVTDAQLVLPQFMVAQLTQRLTQQPAATQPASPTQPTGPAFQSAADQAAAGDRSAAGHSAAGQSQQAVEVLDEQVLAAAAELPQPDKFSVHLVVRLPGGWVFPSNLAVGAAVGSLRRYEDAWSKLQVYKSSDPAEGMTSAVDLAVYSRARNFRCAWCCKSGKQAVLRPTRRYMGALRTPPHTAPTAAAFTSAAHLIQMQGAGHNSASTTWMSNEQIFLASLICNVSEGARVLNCDHLTPLNRSAALAMAAAAANGGIGTWRAMNPGAARRQVSPGEPATELMMQHPHSNQPLKLRWVVAQADVALQTYRDRLQEVVLSAIRFVEEATAERAGGQPTQVRSISYVGDGSKVCYGMLGPGSHYCGCVGRFHRSNHIYLVLDFETGTWVQKCFDPDCAGWHSDSYHIPDQIWQNQVLSLLRPAPKPEATSEPAGGDTST